MSHNDAHTFGNRKSPTLAPNTTFTCQWNHKICWTLKNIDDGTQHYLRMSTKLQQFPTLNSAIDHSSQHYLIMSTEATSYGNHPKILLKTLRTLLRSFTPEKRARPMWTPRDDWLYSLRPFQGNNAIPAGHDSIFGKTWVCHNKWSGYQNNGSFPLFFHHLAICFWNFQLGQKWKGAASGKRKGVSIHATLFFVCKTSEKDSECNFQQDFRTAPLRVGLHNNEF